MTISFVKKVCELLELEQDRSISVQSKTTTDLQTLICTHFEIALLDSELWIEVEIEF